MSKWLSIGKVTLTSLLAITRKRRMYPIDFRNIEIKEYNNSHP